MEARPGPAGGGHGVVAPWFACGQGSHREATVSGALEGDYPLDGGHRFQIVERERVRLLDRSSNLETAIVIGNGEVAANVVTLCRRDVGFECLGRCLSVERLGVDHRQRRTFVFLIVCQSHVASSDERNVLV